MLAFTLYAYAGCRRRLAYRYAVIRCSAFAAAALLMFSLVLSRRARDDARHNDAALR